MRFGIGARGGWHWAMTELITRPLGREQWDAKYWNSITVDAGDIL
jgi:hypothetical protein